MSATCTSSSACSDQRKATKQKCRHHLCGITVFTDLCKAMKQSQNLHEPNALDAHESWCFWTHCCCVIYRFSWRWRSSAVFLEEQLRGCKHTVTWFAETRLRTLDCKCCWLITGFYDSPAGGSQRPKKRNSHRAAFKHQLDYWNTGGFCNRKSIIVWIYTYWGFVSEMHIQIRFVNL